MKAKAFHKEESETVGVYNNLANELQKAGMPRESETIRGFATDERRHSEGFKRMVDALPDCGE